jgi:hypothetical protein
MEDQEFDIQSRRPKTVGLRYLARFLSRFTPAGWNLQSKIANRKSKILGAPLQLASQGLVQAGVDIVRQGKELAITVKLDGFLSSVKHHMAVIAINQVSLEAAL